MSNIVNHLKDAALSLCKAGTLIQEATPQDEKIVGDEILTMAAQINFWAICEEAKQKEGDNNGRNK